MPHEYSIEPVEKPIVQKLKSWIRPLTLGKFGLSLMVGKTEIFLGVALARIEMETVVRKRKRRVLIKENSPRVIDL